MTDKVHKLTVEQRLDRLEELVVGVAFGLAQASGAACVYPVREPLIAVREDIEARNA